MGRPRGPGETNWYSAFRALPGYEQSDPHDVLADIAGRYAAYPPEVGELLAQTTPGALLVQRLYIAPRLSRYVMRWLGYRLVLIGDAAHAMTPNLGRGACESLVDAVALAEALNRRRDLGAGLDEALATYQRQRLMRTQLLRAASTRAMKVAMATTHAERRNALLRRLPFG